MVRRVDGQQTECVREYMRRRRWQRRAGGSVLATRLKAAGQAAASRANGRANAMRPDAARKALPWRPAMRMNGSDGLLVA